MKYTIPHYKFEIEKNLPNYFASLTKERQQIISYNCYDELLWLLWTINERKLLEYDDGTKAERVVKNYYSSLPWHKKFLDLPPKVLSDYLKAAQNARFGLYGIPARYDFPLHSVLGFTTYPKKVIRSERKWIEKSYADYMKDLPNNPTGSTITVAEERIFRIHFEPYGIEPFNPFKLPNVSNKDN